MASRSHRSVHWVNHGKDIRRALDGITVLDLTQIYNGPYATFLMAMAGAEVIKVEPSGGEFLRRRDARPGASLPFAMLNANKRSISLNLKTARGRALFLELAAAVDVVIENYAPGVMDRLGLDYETVRAVNPTIVYASGSGFGQSGPYRDYPAMDLTVQAMSGVMSTTGFAENPPVKAGGAICDFFGGVHLFGAVSTALVHRERNHEGSYIDVAMMESVYPVMASNVGALFGDRDDVPLRTGNQHGGLSLCPYNVYEARDGHIAIICNHDRHWRALLETMGRDDLVEDDRFATMPDRVRRMTEVDDMIEGWTRARDRSDLFARLIANRVPSAPVRELTETIRDPHLHERGMLLEIDHPTFGTIVVCRSPIRFAGRPPPAYQIAPPYGADNDAIYRERLGLSDDEIRALEDDEVI